MRIPNLIKKNNSHACLGLLLVGLLFGCGKAEPFLIAANSTMFVGDPSPATPLAFIVNPEEQGTTGTVDAEIATVFPDRVDLAILSLSLTFQFDSVGTINLSLDPNNPSSATIFELDGSNKSSGTNTMTLNLIIETPDQSLSLPGVLLEGDSALLELAENLPTLGFSFQGQSKELDLSSLNVVVPAELINSDVDPL